MHTARRATQALVASVLVLLLAFSAAAHAASGRAYVATGSPSSVAVVNLRTNALMSRIALAAPPSEVALSPDGTRAYVASPTAFTVSVIDTTTNRLVATIPLGPGHYPVAIDVSPDGSRVYVANSGWFVAVIDAATNTVVGEFTSITNFLVDVAAGPAGGRVYWVENNSNHYGPMPGAVAVADSADGDVLRRIPVYDPGRIAISSDETRAYVTNVRGGISVVDLAQGTVAATIAGGPARPELSADGSRLYVAGEPGSMSVFGTAALDLRATVPVSVAGIAASPDGTRVAVSGGAGTVSLLDTATDTVAATVAVGGSAAGLAVAAARAAPAGKDECKSSGWTTFVLPFRNEGECVRYALAHPPR
jgi:YVTN family beta-propeller protein